MPHLPSKHILFILGIATVVILFLIVGPEESNTMDQADLNGDQISGGNAIAIVPVEDIPETHVMGFGSRGGLELYAGVEDCEECHSDLVSGWKDTGHGKDFTPGGSFPAVNYGSADENFSGNCAVCHVVGLGDTKSGGFDPEERWDSTENTTEQQVGNSHLIGIQCEACHGPASDHILEAEGVYCSDCKMLPDDDNGHSGRGAAFAKWYGIPSVEESCMQNGDSGCHSSGSHDRYTEWKASAHSNQDQLDARSADQDPIGLNSYCARCKSPSQYDPQITKPEYAREYSPGKWHGIGCGDCHDSHANEYDHQLKTTVEEACTACHTNEMTEPSPGEEPHHSQKEGFGGYLGIGVEGSKGMAGVTCVDCHMWETPELEHGYYLTDAIGVERHEAHSYEPSPQACADCHSDLMSRLPETRRPANSTGENEELWTEWDSWGEEWNESVNMWQSVITDWQSDYIRLDEHVESSWKAADEALTSAEENNTASPDTIEHARSLLENAKWNMDLAGDGSRGAHNPNFFTDLLNQANKDSITALMMISENTPPIARPGSSVLITTGEYITYDGTSSMDMDGDIIEYFWDFGDGSNGTGSTGIHAYQEEGTYFVTLRVTDDRGASGTGTIMVIVVAPRIVPEPVDLTSIEDDIQAIRTERAGIRELIEIMNATLGVGDAPENEHISENAKEIEDLKQDLTADAGMIGIGLMLVLVLVLAIAYHRTTHISQEFQALENEIEKALGRKGT